MPSSLYRELHFYELFGELGNILSIQVQAEILFLRFKKLEGTKALYLDVSLSQSIKHLRIPAGSPAPLDDDPFVSHEVRGIFGDSYDIARHDIAHWHNESPL
jgi:hypothetical protein